MKKTTASRGKGWVLAHIKTHPWRFAAAAAAGLTAAGCAAALLFTSGYLISRSALQPENVLLVYVPIVLVRTFGFGKAVVQYLERLLSHDAALRILTRMRVKLYRILEPQALRLFSRRRSGELLGMLAEDIEQLQFVYLRLILPAFTAVLLYGAGIALIGRMDGRFALYMALYCGFLVFALPAFTLLVSRSVRKQSKMQRSLAYQELTDGVFGMSDWMLSGRAERFLAAFQKRQALMAAADRKKRRFEWRHQWLAQCLIGGAAAMMTLWAAMQSAQGAFRPEWIAAFALVGFPLLDLLAKAGEAALRAPDYRESAQRLHELQVPQEEAEGGGADSCSGAFGDSGSLQEDMSGLRLKRVSFQYPGEEHWSLQEIDLHLPPGGQAAIIGRSGAGKTTLMNLIQGELVPSRGSVMINGVPARRFLNSPRRPFAVLNQQPHLFDTTIGNNIRMGRPDASNDEVRRAAEMAGLGKLIDALPEGLETRVREAGIRFSGGERQRIALARVLLQDRPIVLLDEPTAGLDPVTERELLDTIFAALRGKTLLWITHHLIGMEHMDQIIFLDRGRIVMRGTHEELMRTNERYRKLYALDQPAAR